MKAQKRSGFSKWLCSQKDEGYFNPICDLAYDWRRDCRSPKHADTLKEVITYLRSSNACGEAIDTARTAFWIYSVDKRKRSVSAALRFDVLQRDNFTCRYCGRKAPEHKIVVDHVIPFSKGGKCAVDNLVSACEECNTGKSDRLLRDSQ